MLTVAFASHNGADTLPLMLEALTLLHAIEGGWQLIAVDNASTDNTHQLLLSYQDRLPLTVLQQPAKGKSKALNLALEHVQGDLLVLTDDDVIPDPDWLVAWRSYADAHPEFGIFGGLKRPYWLEPPPAWLFDAIPQGLAYSRTKPGLPAGAVDPRYLGGGNMAIRVAAIREGLRFEESRGPSGNHYAMGEDTVFAYEADARGYHAAHCPDAIIQHIILPEQYEKPWLMARAYSYGQSRGAEDATASIRPQTTHWQGMPRWMLREYLKQRLVALVSRITGNMTRHMAATWEASYLAGYLEAYRRLYATDAAAAR